MIVKVLPALLKSLTRLPRSLHWNSINQGWHHQSLPITGQKTSRLVPLVFLSSSRHDFHTTPHKNVFEDRNAKSLTVWNNVKQIKASPLPALTLGISSILPFIAFPTYMITSGDFSADLAFAQVAYGATLLSYIGGVRCGFVLPEENPIPPDWINLGYSVMPSLVAWVGLLLPNPLSLFTLMGGLTLSGYMDMAMYGYPPWYKGLRFAVSFFAVLSLWTTFMCSMLLTKPSKVEKKDKPEESTPINWKFWKA